MPHPYNAIEHRRQQRTNGTAPNASRTMVRWNDDEAERVALASYRLLSIEPISSIDAVLRAQVDVLAPDRHRAIRQMNDLKSSILPIWRRLKAEEQQAPADVDTENLRNFEISKGGALDEVVVEHAADNLVPSESGPARKTSVRWTDSEKLQIARESKRLLAGFADMKPLEAIRKGVEYALPADRHRKITTTAEVRDWITPLWDQVDTEHRAAEAERVAEEARRQAEAAEAEKAEASRAALDPLSLDLDTLIKTIGVKIGERLVGAIGEHLQDAIMQHVVDALRRPDSLPEGTARLHIVPRNHKPRVTVVGLINQQAEDVSRAFPSVEFTFIKSQRSGGNGAHGGTGMLARGANADVVISMTDFTGHDVEYAAKHLNVPFVRLTGSVSSLKRWLTRWLNNEVALAEAG